MTSLGACATWNGRVLLAARDKEDLAVVLTALAGTNTVAVWVDDTVLLNGWCVAQHDDSGVWCAGRQLNLDH